MQEKVALWEASSKAVLALARKRYRKVRLVTSFGTIVLKCRQGIATEAGWTCPALLHLGIRKNQRYSPDMERRMAVLAVETGSYEKAARVADGAAWFSASDGAVHSTIARLGNVAKASPPQETCRDAAGPEDTLIIMADGWNARHRGANWGVDKKKRDLPAQRPCSISTTPASHLHALGAALHGPDTEKSRI